MLIAISILSLTCRDQYWDETVLSTFSKYWDFLNNWKLLCWFYLVMSILYWCTYRDFLRPFETSQHQLDQYWDATILYILKTLRFSQLFWLPCWFYLDRSIQSKPFETSYIVWLRISTENMLTDTVESLSGGWEIMAKSLGFCLETLDNVLAQILTVDT